MRKIPTLFLRDEQDRRYVTTEVNPECQWVLDGEGSATRKYDGTCMMLDENGQWWARREVKRDKVPPPNYMPVERDEMTQKIVGWEPIEQSPFAKFHAEALEPLTEFGTLIGQGLNPGTYELVGPKINGNPERAEHHRLESHANAELLDGFERTYDSLREHLTTWIKDEGIEGIVWHHPDGRMAKLKVRDFPLYRPGQPSPKEASDG
jgi:hypothetical protein